MRFTSTRGRNYASRGSSISRRMHGGALRIAGVSRIFSSNSILQVFLLTPIRLYVFQLNIKIDHLLRLSCSSNAIYIGYN